MILDVRTIVAMLVVSSVLMAITIAVGTRMGHGSGIVKWAAGLALLAVGWTLLAARGALPEFVGVALADSILVAGLCFGLAGLVEFGGRTAPRLLLYGPGPITLALVTALLGRHDAVTLLTGCELAVIFGAMGVAAIRLGPGVGPARWMLVVACFTGAIAILLRAVVIWLNPATYTDVFAGSNQHASVFVVLFACTIVIPVAFLLMQRERAAVELYRLATIDPLTGLFNRRAFLDLAARELARARRLKSWYAVLMLDLDFFKRVNDDYGHQAGDRVLAAFGALVRDSIRTEDLAGRYGGEEFCAILPNTTMPEATAIAERLRQTVSKFPLGELPRAITISIGVVACSGAAGLSLDAVIGRADEAMYRAKHAGRDQVVSLDFAARDGSMVAR